MTLSDDQIDRYARHIILKEIGGDGQQKLLSAHVALIGAGGIGSPAIQYLAAAGVGRLTDDLDAITSRSLNARDDPDWHASRLEQWPLFDVRLDVGGDRKSEIAERNVEITA